MVTPKYYLWLLYVVFGHLIYELIGYLLLVTVRYSLFDKHYLTLANLFLNEQ